MPYLPIENHGVIGDLNTVALVGIDGCIDFLCFPFFDSPTIFASLLDAKKGGKFSISPQLKGKASNKQIYLPDTNVLVTQFLSEDGIAELTDFMPVNEKNPLHALVRQLKIVRGEIRFKMCFSPAFNYAREKAFIENRENCLVFTAGQKDKVSVSLKSNIKLKIKKGEAYADFTLKAGQEALFILQKADADIILNIENIAVYFKETIRFWHNWSGKCKYNGRWKEMVNRSALTLKLLISQAYGSIVAAPTFGLPELIGGERNWDYRYNWIRDAAFTIYALIRLGYTDEAGNFINWLTMLCKKLTRENPLKLMYSLNGNIEIKEEELKHFEGYKASKPVRIGNMAYRQLQLDIYGELLDSVYLYNKYGELISYDFWLSLTKMVDWICLNWQKKDEGIWEVRGGRQHFLYSRLMCWVAVDRGIRLAQKRSFPAPLEKWIKTRDKIYQDIFHNFWDSKNNYFVQYKGSDTIDAAALLMPLVRFISPSDPRWLSTLKAIEENLADDYFIHRYKIGEAAPDGLKGQEGTFSVCTFWYIECLSRSGQLDKARLYLEKMFGHANHLGLYAEQLGPCGEHLGNFPQAFTHLGLISAAYDLNRRISG